MKVEITKSRFKSHHKVKGYKMKVKIAKLNFLNHNECKNHKKKVKITKLILTVFDDSLLTSLFNYIVGIF